AEAVDVRHHQVHDHDRILALFQLLDRIRAVARGVDGEARALDDLRHERTNRRLVVHYEYPPFRTHGGEPSNKCTSGRRAAGSEQEIPPAARWFLAHCLLDPTLR